MRRLTHGTERCGRGALRVTALLTLLTALLAVPGDRGRCRRAAASSNSPAGGCLSGDPAPPTACRPVRALQNVGTMAMSPDGKSVYAPAQDKDAIVVFDRASNGVLSQKQDALGCLTSVPRRRNGRHVHHGRRRRRARRRERPDRQPRRQERLRGHGIR